MIDDIKTYPNIRRKVFFQGLYKQKNIKAQTSFHYDKQHGVFSSLGKCFILTKLILTIDSTIGSAKRGTWCQAVRHKIGDVAGFHTYTFLIL